MQLSQNPSTLYDKLAAKISTLIERGTLRPGERVPSVRTLGRQNRVSVATAIQAYRVLENRGLLEARPQSGFFVRPRLLRYPALPTKTSPPSRPTRLENYESVRRCYLRIADDPSLINFGLALPDPALLPTRQLSRGMASLARRSPGLANVYDVAPGSPFLRAQIARRLIGAGCSLAPEDLVITSGCQEALSLALRAVAKEGDTIAIESPAYFGALGLLETLGMKVCEVPTFPIEGVCLDELATRLDRCRVKACLFMLNFSNPLGSCMPDEKKVRLVTMLAKRGIPLIEDDIFGDISFQPLRPKTAKAYDTTGIVLHCSSFCKSLAPGFRVGWIAPGKFKDRVEQIKRVTTVGNPTLPQLAVAEFLANENFDHHLRRLRRTPVNQ
jgi:DNA-binding transcriptional MocR family regulator